MNDDDKVQIADGTYVDVGDDMHFLFGDKLMTLRVTGIVEDEVALCVRLKTDNAIEVHAEGAFSTAEGALVAARSECHRELVSLTKKIRDGNRRLQRLDEQLGVLRGKEAV